MLSSKFYVAGRAVFTVTVPAEFAKKCPKADPKPHYTFRIKYFPEETVMIQGKPVVYPESWRAMLLTGPNNYNDFTYLGLVHPVTGALLKTTKTRDMDKSFPYALLARVLAVSFARNENKIEENGFSVKHEGKCCRCGRRLTVPESIASGFGPECIKK